MVICVIGRFKRLNRMITAMEEKKNWKKAVVIRLDSGQNNTPTTISIKRTEKRVCKLMKFSTEYTHHYHY